MKEEENIIPVPYQRSKLAVFVGNEEGSYQVYLKQEDKQKLGDFIRELSGGTMKVYGEKYERLRLF